MKPGPFLLLFVWLYSSNSVSQVTRGKTSVTPVATSKAQAWAEAVTDFVADPRLCGTFREADVAQRLKALIPVASLTVDHDDSSLGFGQDPKKGIAGIGYSLAGVAGAPDLRMFEQISIYLPRTDPDGVDVLSQVTALMKRKLRPPWHGNPDPPPGTGYYWVKGSRKQRIIPTVLVDIARSSPVDDGTPNEGPWVEIRFATELRSNGEEM
jgi:hypothetical protein